MIHIFKKNRNFTFYLLGGSISWLGDLVTGLAFLFLAHDLTKSNIYTTGIVIAETVPYLLFGLVGGVIADWVNKKRLLIWIDLLRAPVVLSIFLFHQFGWLTYWHLIVVGFLIQSLGCFFNPAHRAVLPLITSTEERIAANSLLDTCTRGLQVLSPVLTIYLLHTFGVISFYVVDAVSYLVSAFCLTMVTVPETDQPSTEKRKVSDVFLAIKDFIVWSKHEKVIRRLFLVTFLTVFFNTWVWEVGLLLQLKETTVNGEEWYSVLNGWFGAIVIVTNLVIPFIWKQLTVKTYLIGGAIWGIGLFILGLSAAVPITFLGILVAGMGLPLAGLSRVYLLQKLVPTDKQGRGFSFNAMLLYVSNVLSLSLFGVISSYVSLSTLFLFSGGMMVVVGCSYLYLFRKELGEVPYMRVNN